MISGVIDADPDWLGAFVFEGLGILGGVRRLAGSSTWATDMSVIMMGVYVDSDLQFLIPINSSMRPSYVNWVRSGVIISTVRSRMMRESSGAEGSDNKGCSATGFVRRVASRCAELAYPKLCRSTQAPTEA